MWVFLGTVTMLFAAFTSAYLIRRAAADWVRIDLPTILWLNSVVLVASSLALEAGRASLAKARPEGSARWLGVAALLGLVFLAGQLGGWRQLAGQGIFVPTSPHSSFFYILTGLHGLHVLGGLGLLFFAAGRARRGGEADRIQRLVRLCTTYWHFLGGLWIFLFLVLSRL
jgi:cytochrome c oxidase subunit 3